MSLIWRCAAKAAKDALINRVPINEVLRPVGWEIPREVEQPDDMTAKELAAWVRDHARVMS